MMMQLNCSNLTDHRQVGHATPIGLKFGPWGLSRVLNTMVALFCYGAAVELLELDGVVCPSNRRSLSAKRFSNRRRCFLPRVIHRVEFGYDYKLCIYIEYVTRAVFPCVATSYISKKFLILIINTLH